MFSSLVIWLWFWSRQLADYKRNIRTFLALWANLHQKNPRKDKRNYSYYKIFLIFLHWKFIDYWGRGRLDRVSCRGLNARRQLRNYSQFSTINIYRSLITISYSSFWSCYLLFCNALSVLKIDRMFFIKYEVRFLILFLVDCTCESSVK